MYVGPITKPILFVVLLFAIPIGGVFALDAKLAWDARNAPWVEGDVVRRELVDHLLSESTRLEIRIRDEQTGAGDVAWAIVPKDLDQRIEHPVRFRYTGDPSREVLLEAEGNPFAAVAIFWGLPLVLIALFLDAQGLWLLARSEPVQARKPPEYWCGRRELYPSRWVNLFSSAGCLAVAGLGLYVLVGGDWIGAGMIVFGLFGGIFMALRATHRFGGVTLTREGFEIRAIGGADRFAWDDVAAFVQIETRGQAHVGFHLVEDYAGSYDERALGQRQFGVDCVIPSLHGMSVDETLLTMLEWWLTYASESKEEREEA